MSVESHGATAFDTTMAAIGSKATYTGATTSVLGWIMSSEFGVLIGIILGVGGFLINWYYKYKQDKREQELHDQRMNLVSQGSSSMKNEVKPFGLE